MARRKPLMLSLACGLSLGCFLILVSAPFGPYNEWAALPYRLHIQWLLIVAALMALRIAVTLVTVMRAGSLRGGGMAPLIAGLVALATAAAHVPFGSTTILMVVRSKVAVTAILVVGMYFVAIDSDGETIHESAPRSPRRAFKRFAVLGAAAVLLIAVVVVPALFVLRAKQDSALLIRLAGMCERRTCTYYWDYVVAIDDLERCSGGL